MRVKAEPGLVLAAALLAVAVFVLDLSLPLGVAGGVPYVALVLLGWWFEATASTVLLGAVASALTVAGYQFSPDGGVQWVVLTNRALALFAIWVTVALLVSAKRTHRKTVSAAKFPDENPHPVLRVTRDGHVLYANDAARAVAGLTAVSDRSVLAGQLMDKISEVLDRGRLKEIDFVSADRIFALALAPVPGEPYVNIYGRDITERKRGERALVEARDSLEQRVRERTGELEAEILERRKAEARLQHRAAELESAKEAIENQGRIVVTLAENLAVARDQAEAANIAKSEFLTMMSHELRTPMNAILGFSEIIKDETFGPVGSPDYRDYATDIHSSGQHLLRLINDILDLSKIEADMEELREGEIDVAELAASVLGLLRQRAHKSGVTLDLVVPDSAPALYADETKLKQILVNLMTNAVKFTEAGGAATLKIWCREHSGYVFQILDTGIGIALDDIPKALSRFGQVDSVLSRRHDGTGLGLPLARSLAELHGGSLDLQSEVGVGTAVTVRFPAERIVKTPSRTARAIAREHAAPSRR